MKKAILKSVLPAVATLFFILPQACNQSGKNQNETHEHAQTESHEESHDHKSLAAAGLTLNSGAKWEADEPTNKNAAILLSIGKQFSKESNRTLDDYHTFGQDINSGINTMIKECTMEGEADKALHLWFLPLLEQAGTLKDATDTTGLSSVTSKMIHRLNEYDDYFE